MCVASSIQNSGFSCNRAGPGYVNSGTIFTFPNRFTTQRSL